MEKAGFIGFGRIKNLSTLLELSCILLLSFVEFFLLQLSCHIIDYKVSFPVILLNVALLVCLNTLIFSAIANLRSSVFLSYFFVSVISLVNYYTITLHGSPLNIDEIKNASTALNVMGDCSLQLDKIPAFIIASFCIVSLCFLFVKHKETSKSKHFSVARSALFLVALLFIMLSYFSPLKIRPKYAINWSWKYSYGTYGYVTCCLEDAYSRSKIIIVPEGYEKTDTYTLISVLSEKTSNNTNATLVKKEERLPDIILILNETFYDLNRAADLELDGDPLANIHAMEDIYHGYVVVPSVGGGTNRSEYELLTSNSLSLMRSNITPFNLLDLKEANTLVSQLNSLGYVSIGSHPESSLNYNRNKAYDDLGFDYINFDKDFKNIERYRQYESDKSVYANMLEWYEEVKGETPVFSYMLTMQNHGTYEGINPDPNLIHDNSGAFDDADAANEFITSISKSDEAFYELTQYFKDSDRPVIIAMVGDHCPAFAKELLDGEHDEVLNILLRETPAYIWANYDLGIEDHDLGEMGLISFVPTVLDMAGVPGNAYYDYILEMKKSIPILTVEGDVYADAYHKLSNDNEIVKNYQYLEYLNLKEPDWEK